MLKNNKEGKMIFQFLKCKIVKTNSLKNSRDWTDCKNNKRKRKTFVLFVLKTKVKKKTNKSRRIFKITTKISKNSVFIKVHELESTS